MAKPTDGQALSQNQQGQKLSEPTPDKLANGSYNGATGMHANAALYFNAQITSMVRQGEVNSAEDCLNHMVAAGIRPTRSSFNAIINAQKARGHMPQAEHWLRKMLSCGVQPNSMTFTTLISGFATHGDIVAAEGWYQRMLQAGCEPNEQTHNAMVSAYARAGFLDFAEEWMESVLSQRSLVQPKSITFNALIHACSHARRFDKAGRWFEEMLNRGLTPNQSTVRALMACFIENGDPGVIDYYAQSMWNSGLEAADLSYNALIKACARRGDAEHAQKVLDHLLEGGRPVSVSTFNAMLHACTQNGEIARAEQYLQLMKQKNVLPDLVSFNTVINASAAAGDANRAQHWLLQMIDMELIPNEVTYGTICKAYARQGNPDAVKCIMDALDVAGFKLNEYFYASWISAFGAQVPPDIQGAEMSFSLMVTKGLKAHSVKRVLIRVVGERKANYLMDLSKRNTGWSDGSTDVSDETSHLDGADGVGRPPRGSIDLPLSAHQLISDRLRRYMGKHGAKPASSNQDDTGKGPIPKPVPVWDIPMPSFLGKKEKLPATKLQQQIASPNGASSADDQVGEQSMMSSAPIRVPEDEDIKPEDDIIQKPGVGQSGSCSQPWDTLNLHGECGAEVILTLRL